ncbi:MAG: hypothetical protein AB1401_06735 [Thermodesulfobacteriota bacterium]
MTKLPSQNAATLAFPLIASATLSGSRETLKDRIIPKFKMGRKFGGFVTEFIFF